MNCPNCNSEMVERMIAEVMIDECDNCGVLWFDKGELNVYRKKYYKIEIDKDALFNNFKKFKELEDRSCPKCESDNYIISKKENDVFGKCSSCSGVFFSRNIIDRLIKRYEISEEVGSALLTYYSVNGAFSIIEMILAFFDGD